MTRTFNNFVLSIFVSSLWWFAFGLAGWVCLITYWASDNKPPYKLLSYTVFNAAPGGTMFIEMKSERDTTRDCAVNYSRELLDSAGNRWLVTPDQDKSAAEIAEIERDTPGKYRLPVYIAEKAQPGPATLIIPLAYSCNLYQRFWRPIRVPVRINVNILRP